MIDYVIFLTFVILGLAISMAITIWIYKRGIAIRMNAIIFGLCGVFAIAGFIIGKQGITLLTVGSCVSNSTAFYDYSHNSITERSGLSCYETQQIYY